MSGCVGGVGGGWGWGERVGVDVCCVVLCVCVRECSMCALHVLVSLCESTTYSMCVCCVFPKESTIFIMYYVHVYIR